VQAVIFDLDGVLIDSERVWNDVRKHYTETHGGQWRPDAQTAMMGMSSTEWAAFMHGELGVDLKPARIIDEVVTEMAARYRQSVPLLPGAKDAVRRLASRWPLGLASSANRPLIDLVLELTGLDSYFAETLSTGEVGRGKPAPDVYLEVTRRMGVEPTRCTGIEDSTNGILALDAAGLRAIAVPNREFPPTPEALAMADVVIGSLDELTFGLIEPP
jgi:HAD superfamily hydrolase (TIGR01509 family)